MNLEVSAELRSEIGKGPAGRMRAGDRVPGVVYGPGIPSMSISVSTAVLEKLLRGMGGETKLLDLTIDGGTERRLRKVLIREVQIHPVRRKLLHVDFYEVPLDRPIVIDVPVEVVGESIGVKKGGTLNVIRRVLSVRCLPEEIPERVRVEVDTLDLGGSVRVGDLVGKTPFELLEDENVAVVNITAPEGKSKDEAEAPQPKGKGK